MSLANDDFYAEVDAIIAELREQFTEEDWAEVDRWLNAEIDPENSARLDAEIEAFFAASDGEFLAEPKITGPPFGGEATDADCGPPDHAGDTEPGGADSSPRTNGKLAPHHLEMLARRGISPVGWPRAYETVENATCLRAVGLAKAAQKLVPGILFELRHKEGPSGRWTYRPDHPRMRDGKLAKYEMPWRQPIMIDVPPGVGDWLDDVSHDLWVTEGTFKADCGAQRGLCIVAINGVWGWQKDRVALPDWRDIKLRGRRVILAFDSDVMLKPDVHKALRELAAWLKIRGAYVEYLHLPPGADNAKVGLDDYLAEHSVTELYQLVRPELPGTQVSTNIYQPAPRPELPDPIPLAQAHETFTRWLGENYDTDALDVVLSAVAVEKFNDGSDPVWINVIGGSGVAKTETVQPLSSVGAILTSSISSEAALLSGTPTRERDKDATGGLLRRIGARGVLVIKDFSGVLSMDRTLRGKVLAALRDIYDGHWYREIGSGGGHAIEWRGRIAVVGAVTTAWDTHHSVIAAMGDRFVLVRMDSTVHRIAAGHQALAATGWEEQLRLELAHAAGGVIAGMDAEPITLTKAEQDRLLAAADLVTLARTAVEFDYQGKVIDAHAPEMPTRFAKQLGQILRGAVAIGVDRGAAMRLAIRCARDSMPPLRLAIIDDLAQHPDSFTVEVCRRLEKPTNTVDRLLNALYTLGVLNMAEPTVGPRVVASSEMRDYTRWQWSLRDTIDPSALRSEVV